MRWHKSSSRVNDHPHATTNHIKQKTTHHHHHQHSNKCFALRNVSRISFYGKHAKVVSVGKNMIVAKAMSIDNNDVLAFGD